VQDIVLAVSRYGDDRVARKFRSAEILVNDDHVAVPDFEQRSRALRCGEWRSFDEPPPQSFYESRFSISS
jgi:hypothetical protein